VGEQADIYERITGRIIEQMEKASAAGWQKPWITTGQNTLQPVNAATRREYRGVNVLMLWAAAEITGYQDGRWASFKQWQQIGAQVRRGEKGTPVVFYKELPRRGGEEAGGTISGQFEGAAAEATKPGTYLMAKSSYVFNAAQVEGDTPPERPQPPGLAVRLESAERFVAATGAVIVHGGDRAYYRPGEDRIQLPPPEQFRSSEGYYATTLHELTHWSGHKSRLDRDLKGRFGTAAYAAEELVAEIGAAFLCVKAGVTAEPREDHAHYLKSWITVLKADNRAIFTAASQAQKAADYLQGLQPP
jgi:antirestriction protein ArdC